MSIIKITDIDNILISLLEIDDLRNLYQTNTYYRDLIESILKPFIQFYTNIHNIIVPIGFSNTLFHKSIIFGNLKICQYQYKKVNNYDDSFFLVCRYNFIDVAKWTYSVISIKSSLDSQYVNDAFQDSCIFGSLETAKWLHSIGANIRADKDCAFRFSCKYKKMNIVNWLCSIEPSYSYMIKEKCKPIIN